MHEHTNQNLCNYEVLKMCVKNKWNPWQISSKWEPKDTPTGPKASKTSPEVSQRLPEGPQKWQRRSKGGAGVDLVVFYSSKWEPKGILEAARASKICPEASQKRPKGIQEHHQISIQALFLNKSWKIVPECIQKHARIHEISSENRHGFECAATWKNIVKLQ